MDCFEILGVRPGAHLHEVRSAFRRLALSCHPDVAGPQAAKQFEVVAAAYARVKSATPAQIAESLKKKSKATREQSSPFSWRRPPRRRKGSDDRESERERSQRVQDLLLERALVEAELALARILEKASREEESRSASSLTKRLLSAHPAVRLLALGVLSGRAPEQAVFTALVEMLRAWPPDDEIVESLLLVRFSQEQKQIIASTVGAKSAILSELSAMALLRWASLMPEKAPFLLKMLSHPSSRVLARTLALWPRKELPDELSLIRLLKMSEDEVLVPLLTILRGHPLPAWARGRVKMLAEKHPSPAVRVWALSIVRARNLV